MAATSPWEVAQAVTTVFGLPVLVLSVLLLAWQTVSAARATRASLYQNIATLMIEIDRFFIERPELRPYFYESADVADGAPDCGVVTSTAEMLADFFENVLDQVPALREEDTLKLWESYMGDVLGSSPALRRHILAHPSWYSKELQGRTARATPQ